MEKPLDAFRQESDWKELPLPDLGVDYAVAYTDIFPTVVLAKGDKAVKFYFMIPMSQ